MRFNLWLAMGLGCLLFIATLHAIEVPRNLTYAKSAQASDEQLSDVRTSLFSLNAAERDFSLSAEGDLSNAQSIFSRYLEETAATIRHFATSAAYNPELIQRIQNFTIAYDSWLEGGKYLLGDQRWHAREHTEDADLATHLSSNHERFLLALEMLEECEPLIHHDMARGNDAVRLLRWSGATFVLYLFLCVAFHKRTAFQVLSSREQALARSHRLLAEAQRIAKLGHWELDHVTNSLCWSDETYQIFGLDPATSELSYETFIGTVHPDDREYVANAYHDAISSRTPYDVIHRISLEDGSTKFVHERCETEYSQQGLPTRSIGTVHDISEQVYAEEELRLSATTFQTHAGILITDTNGGILRVNPAFEDMTGYSSDELIGQNPSMLKSDHQDSNFYKLMWTEILECGQWQGELWNRRKDNSLYAEWLTITAVKNQNGETTHYVGASQDITDRKLAETRIEHLAYHDELTNLANRRLLLNRLEHELEVAKRHSTYGILLYLDLDHFKHLNDALGHISGDELLRMVGKRLQQQVRSEDTVARIGGDEFVILLSPHSLNASKAGIEAQYVGQKILDAFAEVFVLSNKGYKVTASIGIAVFPDGNDQYGDILKHADSALFKAKGDSRNTFRFYHPDMDREATKRLKLEQDLRLAIQHGQLSLHYQPQVSQTGEIVGAEALIRWEHPEKGMIPPNRFIQIAEESGQIIEIGTWVLDSATKQIRTWLDDGILTTSQCVAINVSPRQFHQSGFVKHVLDTVKRADIPPCMLKLEITEGLIMDNVEESIVRMQQLRDKGLLFSVDDFGTGYSSLSYLKRLPLDQLKIDRAFVRDIASDPNDAAIVDTIIAMTRHLGHEVIAEGVETQEQLAFLKRSGCQLFQGYYFSRPIPAPEFALLLTSGISRSGTGTYGR